MGRRYPIADEFFDCVSSFSEKSGALGFDSGVEFIGGKPEKGLRIMTCSARYDKFDMIYEYRGGGGTFASSVFDIRVVLDRSRSFVRYSLYDVMYLLDSDNFRCYRFPFIESPERMRACFDSIKDDILFFLPRLDAMASQSSAVADIDAKFRDAVFAFYNKDIFAAFDSMSYNDDGVEAERDFLSAQLQQYYELSSSRFNDPAYSYYLSGKYGKALKRYSRFRNRNYYEIRLISFIGTLSENEPYSAVADGCNTLSDRFSAKTDLFDLLRFLAASLILMPVLCAVFLGLHYLFSYALFHGCIYSTAYSFECAGYSFLPALVVSLGFSFYLRNIPVKLLPAKIRKKITRYDCIDYNRSNGCIKFIAEFLAVAGVVIVLLNANSAMTFYKDGFNERQGVFDFGGVYTPYESVDKLVLAEGRYNVYGEFIEYPSYIICTKNKGAIDTYTLISVKDAEKHIVPIFVSRGFKVENVRDANDYTQRK